MFRFNLWARPFLPPTGQGLESGPFFPGPLGVSQGISLTGSDVSKNAMHIHDKEKDNTTYSAAAFPFFRPAEGLPPALYSPLHQHFLRAQLELATAHSREELHNSAFVPAKRQRTEDMSPRSLGSPVASGGGRRELGSPRSVGSSGQLAREATGSPASVSSQVSSPRDGRQSATPSDDGGHCLSPPEDGVRCPICRMSVPAPDMTSHLAKEIQELHRLEGSRSAQLCEEKRQTLKSRYETFLRIRGNREGRLAKLRGLRRKRPHEEFLNSSMEEHCKREEDEQIDVLSCDDPDTRLQQTSPDSTDRPHDLSRKTTSPPDQDSQSRDSLCCTGCTLSFTKVTPVTSTKCWHVQCDACWSKHSQAVEKCPQCHIPVSPEDLRRIYL